MTSPNTSGHPCVDADGDSMLSKTELVDQFQAVVASKITNNGKAHHDEL